MGKKYYIGNFYVGELYLSHKFNGWDLKVGNTANHDEFYNKIKELYKNGAIKFHENMIERFVDWNERRAYEGILTIFYKDDEECICLHNNKCYKQKDDKQNHDDFYANLMPLSTLLPKVDYNIPNEITKNGAMELFDLLFRKKLFESVGSLYYKSNHNINDFYVGTFNLCAGFLPNNDERNYRFQYTNVAEKAILQKNGIDPYQMNAKIIACIKDGYPNFENCHTISSYKCLFLKKYKGMYNIHSYQICRKGIMGIMKDSDHDCEANYYENMKPLREVIAENDIYYNNDEITIPKAMVLFKKMNINSE